MKVVVIDDVITTGGSSILAVDRIVEFGCEVVQVVGIVDRMQGGAQNFTDRGLPFRSLLTIEDFGIGPPEEDA
jgi:orotate phosphoribosyltransferase